MHLYNKFIGIALAAVLVLCICSFAPIETRDEGEIVGKDAPDFTLPLLFGDGEDEEVTLSDAPTPPSEEKLPDPVCPQGAPSVPPGEPAESPPPPPGQSNLDAPTDTRREEEEPKGGDQ